MVETSGALPLTNTYLLIKEAVDPRVLVAEEAPEVEVLYRTSIYHPAKEAKELEALAAEEVEGQVVMVRQDQTNIYHQALEVLEVQVLEVAVREVLEQVGLVKALDQMVVLVETVDLGVAPAVVRMEALVVLHRTNTCLLAKEAHLDKEVQELVESEVEVLEEMVHQVAVLEVRPQISICHLDKAAVE